MRVVQLGAYPPPFGGVQTHIVALRNFLRARGHYCGAISLIKSEPSGEPDVYYPRSAGGVIQLLRELEYDILHLHFGGIPSLRLLALALVCAYVPRSRTVLTFHSGGYPFSEEGKKVKPGTLRGLVYRQLDCIIVVNQQLKDLFHRFGVKPDRVRLIFPHALPGAPPTVDWPERIGQFIAEHSPLFLTVGLLEPEYDLPLQIDVVGALREVFPRAGLLIAGSGSLHCPLQKHIATKSYKDHVLLYGDVPHQVTLRLLAEADVFWRTTLFDGDSVSVREAAHFGTPVIATDNGMRPPGLHLIPAQNFEALRIASIEEVKKGRRPPGPARTHEENMEAVYGVYKELMAELGK